MHPFLRQLVKRTPLYQPLRNWAARRRQVREYDAWLRAGRPLPPPHLLKQRTLLAQSERFGLRILVETGTYHGDMVEALKNRFDRIYSIELSRDLYEQAALRFRGVAKIELLQGDSGAELARILPKLDRPALFWLDGHYSAGDTAKGERDTPIFQELRHILGAPDQGHVIVIDDARCFGTDPAYPTIDELSAFIRSRRSNVDITVEDDSIRVIPQTSPARVLA